MTADDLSHLDSTLKSLAATVHATALQAHENHWSVVVLDVRFSAHDKSFIDKVRVELSDGSLVSLLLPAVACHQLIELGQVRASDLDQWYGLLLRVTAAGACVSKLNYDPACAEDVKFFES